MVTEPELTPEDFPPELAAQLDLGREGQIERGVSRLLISDIIQEVAQSSVRQPLGGPFLSVDEIATEIESIASETKYTTVDVFQDLVEFICLSLSSAKEQRYLNLSEKYTDDNSNAENPLDHLSAVFGMILEEMATTGHEVFGDIHSKLELTDDSKGQFFTPHSTSASMAEMFLLTNRFENNGDKDPIRISDPTCGSGRLLFYAHRRLQQQDGDTDPAVFYGTDLSKLSARTAAINMALLNVPAEIVHGNSLTLEAYTVFKIRPTEVGGVIHIHDPEDVSHQLSS